MICTKVTSPLQLQALPKHGTRNWPGKFRLEGDISNAKLRPKEKGATLMSTKLPHRKDINGGNDSRLKNVQMIKKP